MITGPIKDQKKNSRTKQWSNEWMGNFYNTRNVCNERRKKKVKSWISSLVTSGRTPGLEMARAWHSASCTCDDKLPCHSFFFLIFAFFRLATRVRRRKMTSFLKISGLGNFLQHMAWKIYSDVKRAWPRRALSSGSIMERTSISQTICFI